MSDIVERLRDREICPCELAGHQDTINEAADKIEYLMRAHDDMSDTIETLRARVAELEEALRYIAWEQKEGDQPHLIARAALAKTGARNER